MRKTFPLLSYALDDHVSAWCLLILAVLAAGTFAAAPPSIEPAALYPAPAAPTKSPGDLTYFVDPALGNDTNLGTDAAKPWESLAKVNALSLSPGDKVVIAPGLHQESLKPTAAGTSDKPVIIKFLPGIHEFAIDEALRRPWYISNSCDAPQVPKPLAILVENSKHLRLEGGGLDGPSKTEILLGGRMIYFINNQAEDITYTNLVFDLKRPTVSEFRVTETAANSATIQVAEGSTYEIKNGKFAWTGDIGSGGMMVQQAIPETGKCWRIGKWDPFSTAVAEDLGNNRISLTYPKGNFGMVKGRQFQFRRVFRDSVAGHNTRSKNITIQDCDFYALTNMGIVSQFTENITYQHVRVAPPPGTIRTCPAWADAFHFSGCKGDILVDSCTFSGLQDDPVNVHGTHLRIIRKVNDNQLLIRYMQPQTYGFAPYAPGDEMAVIDHTKLRELPGNPHRNVTAVAPDPDGKTGHDWVLTLDGPVPAFGKDDVVDNLTWYPNFTARNNFVTMDSCRGFLVTTRGKVLVEGNTFQRCAMPGLLVEDDAEGWFESGPIRDMTIRNNRFIECGIEINPHSTSHNSAEPVHENIVIQDNFFDGGGIAAGLVKGLTIAGNRSPGGTIPINLQPTCTDVKNSDNNRAAQQ